MNGARLVGILCVLAVFSPIFVSGQTCVAKDTLTVTPNVVSYVGGEDVVVSGPCFAQTDNIVLKIDQWTPTQVNCSYLDQTRCLCRLSYLDVIARLNVRLAINGKDVAKGVLISQSVPASQGLGGLQTYYLWQNISQEITLRWAAFNPADIASTTKVELLYVWIDNAKFETHTRVIKELSATDTTTVINLSTFGIELVDKFDVKAIKSFIVIASSTPISADMEFKKWLKIATLVVLDKMDVASQACKNWHAKEPDVDVYVNNLPACWPRVPLRADGNFVENFADFVKDPSCNPYGGSCWYHPGAKGCFRAMKTYKGAGQQCCYGPNGVLLVGPPGGSTFDLGHSIYQGVGHFYEDVVSYFICCIHSDNCALYYEKRPSEYSNWKPQALGGVTGDPHFLTFDNVKYTFNGHGEFTLLQVLDDRNQPYQNVQIRMLPLTAADGSKTKGTVLKAIAIKSTNPESDQIQIELRDGQKELLLLGGVEYDFEQVKVEYITVVDANIVTIDNGTGYLIQLSNEINIELQMTPDKTAFFLVVRIPQWLAKKTRGLLGTFDNSASNDFQLPDGTVVTLDANNDRDVFEKFGKLWQTTKETSVFIYSNGKDHSSYVDANYIPSFITDGVSFTDATQEAKDLCGADQQCLFDVAITGQLEIGRLTKRLAETQLSHNRINELNAKTCTPLSIIYNNGVIERTLLFANESGSAYDYTFKCNSGFCLSEKYDRVQCSLGKYDKSPPVCEKCNGSSISVSSLIFQLALVLAVILLVQMLI